MAAAQRNHGLRGWLSTVRSALDGPAAGRLQLSLSTSPQPPGPVQAVQDAAPGAATAGGPASPTQVQPAAAAEQERLLRRGSSGVAAAAAAAAAEAGQAQDAALDGEPLAAAAEQHRLASAGVDLRAVATGLERGLPYVALLLLLFAWQHIVVRQRAGPEGGLRCSATAMREAEPLAATPFPHPCRACRCLRFCPTCCSA